MTRAVWRARSNGLEYRWEIGLVETNRASISAWSNPNLLRPNPGRRPYTMSLGLCTSAWRTTRIVVGLGAVKMSGDVQLKSFSVGNFDNNVYILVDPETKDSVLFDAPTDAPRILKELEGTNL